jgi:hypothetical protein
LVTALTGVTWVRTLVLALPGSQKSITILGGLVQLPISFAFVQVLVAAIPGWFYLLFRDDDDYFPRGPDYKGKFGWRKWATDRKPTRLDLSR